MWSQFPLLHYNESTWKITIFLIFVFTKILNYSVGVQHLYISVSVEIFGRPFQENKNFQVLLIAM